MGGFGIVIEGANFDLPPPPVPTGFVGGSSPQTVKVEFDGEPATRVDVLSSSRLFVIVPAYRGDPEVEDIVPSMVRVVNLDPDTGEELPGISEETTVVDGWKYRRPQLDSFNSPGNLKRMVRQVLQTFKRQIIPNVALTTHTDYDDTVSDMLNLVALAELPALVLTGPELRNNRFYSLNQPQYIQSPTNPREFNRLRPAKTVDLVFGMIGADDHSGVAINLQDVVEQFFEVNKFMELDRDSDDPGKGRVQFEMELIDEPSIASAPNESNVRHFTGSFEIRGFDIELGAVEQSFEVDDPRSDTSDPNDDGEVIIEIASVPEA